MHIISDPRDGKVSDADAQRLVIGETSCELCRRNYRRFKFEASDVTEGLFNPLRNGDALLLTKKRRTNLAWWCWRG